MILLKRVELTMHIKIALLDSIVSSMHYAYGICQQVLAFWIHACL